MTNKAERPSGIGGPLLAGGRIRLWPMGPASMLFLSAENGPIIAADLFSRGAGESHVSCCLFVFFPLKKT